MKTEFLTGLGLSEEQVKSIMAENGKDIKREQDKTVQAETDRDTYKGQLDTAQETLKGFEGVDVKDLQGKITTLTNDLKTKDEEYQKELSERDFNTLLDSHISSVGAKNTKAVKALIDMDTLKSSKNQETDIKAAIEACQKENAYMFGENEPINNANVGATTGGTPPFKTGAMNFNFTGVRPKPQEQ